MGGPGGRRPSPPRPRPGCCVGCRGQLCAAQGGHRLTHSPERSPPYSGTPAPPPGRPARLGGPAPLRAAPRCAAWQPGAPQRIGDRRRGARGSPPERPLDGGVAGCWVFKCLPSSSLCSKRHFRLRPSTASRCSGKRGEAQRDAGTDINDDNVGVRALAQPPGAQAGGSLQAGIAAWAGASGACDVGLAVENVEQEHHHQVVRLEGLQHMCCGPLLPGDCTLRRASYCSHDCVAGAYVRSSACPGACLPLAIGGCAACCDAVQQRCGREWHQLVTLQAPPAAATGPVVVLLTPAGP